MKNENKQATQGKKAQMTKSKAESEGDRRATTPGNAHTGEITRVPRQTKGGTNNARALNAGRRDPKGSKTDDSSVTPMIPFIVYDELSLGPPAVGRIPMALLGFSGNGKLALVQR